MNTDTAGTSSAIDNEDTCPPGGCDWEFCDDSFDHEFGTETIQYEECRHCGTTRALESDWTSYDPPEREQDTGWENGRAY